MSNQTVLVTGGAGYVGSHTCKMLSQCGYLPVTYDNLSMGHTWAVQWGPLEVGDIADEARLNQVISQYDPIAVMHFAANAYVGESVFDPGKYWNNNVGGSLSLIHTAVENGIDKFIFSSTCSIYGEPEFIPLNERHPQQPINPYATTKLVIETMLRDFVACKNLNAVCLRYFNAAGADLDGEIGESHDPETHLIPLSLMATEKDNTLTVYGDDYSTRDGSCIRDYIHVTDLAQAHVLALDFLEKNRGFHGFNLGCESGHSVFEVINIVKSIAGKRVNYTIGERRNGDPSELISDSTLARKKLKWQPQHSDIQTIIASAWRWMEKSRSIKFNQKS